MIAGAISIWISLTGEPSADDQTMVSQDPCGPSRQFWQHLSESDEAAGSESGRHAACCPVVVCALWARGYCAEGAWEETLGVARHC